MILLKNANIYGPEFLGKKDILIENNIIGEIDSEIELNSNIKNFEVVDADGDYVFPGFIDNHVHICGGGGEGGFTTRVPPINLSSIVKSGVTTVVGLLGTDGVTRTIEDLVAKAKALNEEGITCYVLTGSYKVPPINLTGSINKDIVFIDNIIGTGEIAIADHRSSQPSLEDIKKLVAETRRAGMISNKGGVVNFHLGKGENGIKMLEKVVEQTEIPFSNILPTHVNRNKKTLKQGFEYVKKGGFIDLTAASVDEESRDAKAESVAKILSSYIEEGLDISNITISSDAQGSLPKFDEQGNLNELKSANMDCLFEFFRKSVLEFNIPFDKALKPLTSNVADIHKLANKGYIKKGNDADLIIVDKDKLSLESVIAKGKFLKNKKELKKGVFED